MHKGYITKIKHPMNWKTIKFTLLKITQKIGGKNPLLSLRTSIYVSHMRSSDEQVTWRQMLTVSGNAGELCCIVCNTLSLITLYLFCWVVSLTKCVFITHKVISCYTFIRWISRGNVNWQDSYWLAKRPGSEQLNEISCLC